MSGGGGRTGSGATMSDGLKLGEGTEAGGVSEIQCIMDNSHMGTLPDPVNRQTQLKISLSRNFVGGR